MESSKSTYRCDCYVSIFFQVKLCMLCIRYQRNTHAHLCFTKLTFVVTFIFNTLREELYSKSLVSLGIHFRMDCSLVICECGTVTLACHFFPRQPLMSTRTFLFIKEALIHPSESMKNVSKSGSSSETRASTKSSVDGLFCNMPA